MKRRSYSAAQLKPADRQNLTFSIQSVLMADRAPGHGPHSADLATSAARFAAERVIDHLERSNYWIFHAPADGVAPSDVEVGPDRT